MSVAVTTPRRTTNFPLVRIQCGAGVLALVTCVHLAIWFPSRIEACVLLALSLSWTVILAYSLRQAATRVQHTQTSRLKCWAINGGMTLLLSGAILILCWTVGAWQGQKTLGFFDKSYAHWLTVKLPTVIVQQAVLQWLIVPLLITCFCRKQLAVGCGAVIFASLHFPNPLLMLLTLVGGAVWVGLYLTYRQLVPIVLSHLLLAILVAGCCGEYIFNLRVGPSCVELLPKTLQFDEREIIVFPAAVSGCVERLSQDADRLILEGWVVDGIHAKPPKSFAVAVGPKFCDLSQADVELAGNYLPWVNARVSGHSLQNLYRFKVSVPVRELIADLPVEVYAENANGWYSRLGKMGEIMPIRLTAVDHPTLIFPREIDGRIGNMVFQNGRTKLIGWLADIKAHSVPNDLWVVADGQWFMVDLDGSRKTRPDIAKSFGAPSISECGFEFVFSSIDLSRARECAFFASDSNGMMHRLPLTPCVVARMAERRLDRPLVR